jgi:uncharacterized YccA/Bax inhibitor family protein
MESRNPAFRGGSFGEQARAYTPSAQHLQDMYDAPAYVPPQTRAMTLDDVVVRSFLTLVTLVAAAAAAWVLVPTSAAMPVLLVSVVLEIGLWALISFGRKANAPLVLAFAAAYGVAVGIISHAYNDLYHGVVLQAVIGTTLAFAATLAVYSLRIVRVTPRFTRFAIAAGFALLAMMVIDLLFSAFGAAGGIGIRDGSPLAYVFSVVAILVGCFFLLLDFDTIERGVQQGAPEKFAWYCAFGLVLSLVWIYLEMLRLLSYLQGGRR